MAIAVREYTKKFNGVTQVCFVKTNALVTGLWLVYCTPNADLYFFENFATKYSASGVIRADLIWVGTSTDLSTIATGDCKRPSNSLLIFYTT